MTLRPYGRSDRRRSGGDPEQGHRGAVRVGFNREGRWRGRLYTHLVRVPQQPTPMIRHHLMSLDALGTSVAESRPLRCVRQEDEVASRAALAAMDIEPGERFIAVHPGARYWFKRWPAERFAGLIDYLQGKLDVKVVGLFGPSDPTVWGPDGQGHLTISKGIDCRPCFPRGCQWGEANCMGQIELDEVIPVVEKLLGQPTKGAATR